MVHKMLLKYSTDHGDGENIKAQKLSVYRSVNMKIRIL